MWSDAVPVSYTHLDVYKRQESDLPTAGKKPLSVAVEELYDGDVKILSEADATEEDD